MTEVKKGTKLPPQGGGEDSPTPGSFDVGGYIKRQAEHGASRPNPLAEPREEQA
jgi:hypothetical protein